MSDLVDYQCFLMWETLVLNSHPTENVELP